MNNLCKCGQPKAPGDYSYCKKHRAEKNKELRDRKKGIYHCPHCKKTFKSEYRTSYCPDCTKIYQHDNYYKRKHERSEKFLKWYKRTTPEFTRQEMASKGLIGISR